MNALFDSVVRIDNLRGIDAARAQIEGRLLITRNTRDFSASDPGIHVPYTL
ncbi:MAG: hypothetical protein H6745_28265 [Deltaproteobacteria bacterium]|nr:hypothetical protein [Deltaproteobacteria bacterium]